MQTKRETEELILEGFRWDTNNLLRWIDFQPFGFVVYNPWCVLLHTEWSQIANAYDTLLHSIKQRTKPAKSYLISM